MSQIQRRANAARSGRAAPIPKGAPPEGLNRSGDHARQPRLTALPVLLGSLLVVLVLLSLAPVLQAGFIELDDDLYVTYNPHVQSGLTPNALVWAWKSSAAANWHPLTWWGHMLSCQLFGLQPRGHHLLNLVLHACNTVLLFELLRRLTHCNARSFFVAALFGVHPLHVESVAWVSELKDVLSTLFFFLTLLAYAAYAHKSGKPKPESKEPKTAGYSRSTSHVSGFPHLAQARTFYCLALVFFTLGLLSKPMLVTLPFLLLLLDVWPLARTSIVAASRRSAPNSSPGNERRFDETPPRKSWAFLFLEKLPFFALAAGSCVVTFLVQRHAGAVEKLARLPLALRVENSLISYARYLGKCFWPVDLAVFYPHPGAWPGWQVALAALLVVSFSALAVLLARRYPYWPVGWFWFLGTMVPVLGLVQVGRQAMADRYTYVPLIGVFILVTWSVCDAVRARTRARQAVSLAGAVAIAWCAWLAHAQAGYWVDSETLWSHALAVTHGNFMAEMNLGLALEKRGLLEEARQHFAEAVRLQPGAPEPRGNLANALFRQGRFEESIRMYEETLSMKPDSLEAHVNLGVVLCRVRRFDEGLSQFEAALRLQPDLPDAHFYLAMALEAKGNREAALGHLERSLELRPHFPEAEQQLRILRGRAGTKP